MEVLLNYLLTISSIAVLLASLNTYSNNSTEESCGNSGSIQKRIQDCEECNDQSSNKNFKLVSRSDRGQEVYLQVTQNLLWSDKLMDGTMPIVDAAKACDEFRGIDPSKLRIDWTLPSKNQFIKAFDQGIITSAPNFIDKNGIAYGYWSSTMADSPYKWAYWFFDNTTDEDNYYTGSASFSVRCVAKLITKE
jgi:hypothetical protein